MKNKSGRRRRRIKRLSSINAKQQARPEIAKETVRSSAKPNAGSDRAKKATEMWRGIYESLVFRQFEAQVEYWKERVKNLEKENEELRNQLNDNVPVYETSSSEEDIDDEQERYLQGVDENWDDKDLCPEYLEFRSVTLKHREELRKQRERECIEKSIEHSIIDDNDKPLAEKK